MFLGESLVSWKTKKQKTTSKSSAESEYRSMSQATSEIVWIVGVLEDLGVHVPTPISLFCDNKSAHYIGQNPVFHERTKHLEIDCHYVRDHVETGFLVTTSVRSALQLADILTKGLSRRQHAFLMGKLGLVRVLPVQLAGGVKNYG